MCAHARARTHTKHTFFLPDADSVPHPRPLLAPEVALHELFDRTGRLAGIGGLWPGEFDFVALRPADILGGRVPRVSLLKKFSAVQPQRP